MVLTRNMAGTSSALDQDTSSDSSGPQALIHQIPLDQLLGNLVIDEAPREPRLPRERETLQTYSTWLLNKPRFSQVCLQNLEPVKPFRPLQLLTKLSLEQTLTFTGVV